MVDETEIAGFVQPPAQKTKKFLTARPDPVNNYVSPGAKRTNSVRGQFFQQERYMMARPQIQLRQDALGVIVLFISGFILAYAGSSKLSPAITDFSNINRWFDADPPMVARVMSERGFPHGGVTPRHPLFTLLTCPLVIAGSRILGVGKSALVQVFICVIAGLWLSVFFWFLRLMGLRRLDAAIFATLAAFSAASVFFFTVPETHSFGALTLAMAMAAIAYLEAERRLPRFASISIAAYTLAITVTNFMAGIALMLAGHPRREAVRNLALAVLLVLALSFVQEGIFPNAMFFWEFGSDPFTWRREFYFGPEGGWRYLSIGKAFLFHSIVLPEIRESFDPFIQATGHLSVQQSVPGSGGTAGMAALAGWLLLLGLATWSFAKEQRARRTVRMLLLLLGWQFAIMAIFGRETFVYSLNFAPLLVAFVSIAALGRLRRPTLLLAAATALLVATNNIQRFYEAAEYVERKYRESTKGACLTVPGADKRVPYVHQVETWSGPNQVT